MVAHDTPAARRPILLFAFANDGRAGRYLPSLGAEIGALRQVLSKAADRGLCELMVRESTTREELLEIFSDARYRGRIALVHFAGHATADYLLLEGAGTPVAAYAGGLVQLLSALESLEVVYLNGCSTLSHARRLIEAGVPAAISTEWPVSDDAARRFAVDFYRELGGGFAIGEAFERALAAAKCFSGMGESGPSRDLTAPPRDTEPDPPWRLAVAGSGEEVRRWSLPSAAHDPLFGIPAPTQNGLPQEPFRGLRRFTAKDAGIFFGRGDLIRSLYEDVTNPELPHALVVYGPSGAGKSSLLEAGLLPRLRSKFDVHLLRFKRGRDPEQELLEALDAKRGANVAEAWLAREHNVGRPVAICVDQLESLIIGSQGDAELSRFVWALAPLLGGETRPGGKLILGLRKEWFPELRDALRGHALRWQDHYVKPLDHRGIEEVILGPTRTGTLRARYGIEVEPGLARRIADDLLGDPRSAIAPTLQVLLTRMWDEVASDSVDDDGRARRRFSSALYDRLRREGLALGDFVHRQLVALGTQYSEALASGLIYDLLFHHTTSRGTSANHSLAATFARYPEREGLVSDIIDRCESLYLLQRVADGVEQRASTRLAHDTLAPIIRESYERSQAPGQVAARVLDARIRTADDRRRPPPLDAFDLELVEAGRAGMRAWTEGERRLVRRSRGRHVRAAWIRGLRVLFVVGSVAFGLQFIFGSFRESRGSKPPTPVEHTSQGRYQPAKFETKAPVTLRAALEHRSENLDLGEPTSAVQHPSIEEFDEQRTVPMEAVREPSPVASRLGPAATSSRCSSDNWSTGLSSAIGSVVVSPDGKLVALGMKAAQRVFVFNPTIEPPSHEELELEAHASRLAWSPNGGRLVVGEASRDERGFVELFARDDTGSFGEPIDCDGHHDRVDVAVFSQDGEHLITGDHGGLVILRDGASCEHLDHISLEGRVYDATELPNDRWAFGGAEAQTLVWPIGTSNSPFNLTSTGRAVVHSVAVSPDGEKLLTTGDRIYVRDSRQGEVLGKDGDREVVQWAAWLGMRSVIVVRTRTRVLRWRWADGKLSSPRELEAIDDAVIAVSVDGDDVFVGDQTGRVHWWRFRGDDLEPHDELPLLDGSIESLATHPKGAYIVAGGNDGRARILALDERKRPCQDLLEENRPLP